MDTCRSMLGDDEESGKARRRTGVHRGSVVAGLFSILPEMVANML